MQGILLQIRYFERELSKSLKKDNFIFLSNLMSSVCLLNVIRMSCHSYVTRMYSYVTRMSLVCTRMSFVCTRMSSVCHSYVLVCHPYVTRISSVRHPYFTCVYSYVIRMPLVCTRMSFVSHSYVILPWTFFKHFSNWVTEATTGSALYKAGNSWKKKFVISYLKLGITRCIKMPRHL